MPLRRIFVLLATGLSIILLWALPWSVAYAAGVPQVSDDELARRCRLAAATGRSWSKRLPGPMARARRWRMTRCAS